MPLFLPISLLFSLDCTLHPLFPHLLSACRLLIICHIFHDSNNHNVIAPFSGHALYVCPNQPCSFKAPNAALFKDHMPTCPHAIDLKSMGCPHCKKRVKAIVNLLEHLKTHGQQKQVCSLCTFKTWATSELTRHMKVHR